MRRGSRRAVLATATMLALVAAGAGAAFQINPLKNKYRGNSPRGGFMERVTQSVHEDLTDAAVACVARWSALPPGAARPPCLSYGPPPRRHDEGNKADPLIRGVWWNDDPNQLLWRWDYPTWVVWMDDAHRIATRGRNWLGRRTTLNQTYKMQYRSHYGDLQFLHAMANADGETAAEVRERILLWAGFAYRVALGDIPIGTRLEDVDDEVARRFFARQPGWTVNYLFGPKYRWNAETMPDVALGTILHMVQDSFSRAHVERGRPGSAGCQQGGIVEFHAYGGQDPALHGSADTRAALEADAGLTDRLNPVEAGATMLALARERADWRTVVEPWLRDVAFCLEDPGARAGPGRFAAAPRTAPTG